MRRVFRGASFREVASRDARWVVVWIAIAAGLATLGLLPRGASGWILAALPPIAFLAWRLWLGTRVSVVVDDGQLRFEGLSTLEDFELPLGAIRGWRWRSSPGSAILLRMDDRERIVDALSPGSARALTHCLVELGISKEDGPAEHTATTSDAPGRTPSP